MSRSPCQVPRAPPWPWHLLTAVPERQARLKQRRGVLKVAFVSFPGACAKGRNKSFFSTQDPLFELFLERISGRAWRPSAGLSGQCSLNLKGKGEIAAGHTDMAVEDRCPWPCTSPSEGVPVSLPSAGGRGEGSCPALPHSLGDQGESRDRKAAGAG